MAKRVGKRCNTKNWKKKYSKIRYSIRRSDSGMIGFENPSNDKIELAFDQKCLEHVHLAELEFQSIQIRSFFGILAILF